MSTTNDTVFTVHYVHGRKTVRHPGLYRSGDANLIIEELRGRGLICWRAAW